MSSTSNRYAYYSFPPTPTKTSPSGPSGPPNRRGASPASTSRPAPMAPSPTVGGGSAGQPKTPTKLAKRPGQTPQKQGQSGAAAPDAAGSGGRPKASTPKASEIPRQPTDVGTPTRTKGGNKMQKPAGAGAATEEGSYAQALQKQSKARVEDEKVADDDDDDDGDDETLSKSSPAGQAKPREALEVRAPVPVDDDEDGGHDVDGHEDNEEDAVGGAQEQELVDAERSPARGFMDDSTEKAGETAPPAGNEDDASQGEAEAEDEDKDEKEDGKVPSQQAQAAPGSKNASASKAADKAHGTVRKPAQDPKDVGKDVTDNDAKPFPDNTAAEDANAATDDATHEGKKVPGEAPTDQTGRITTEDAKGDTSDDSASESLPAAISVRLSDIPVPEGLPVDLSELKGLEVDAQGDVYDSYGKPAGRLVEGDAEDLAGYPIGEDGEILDDDGDLVGRVELRPEEVKRQLEWTRVEGQKISESARRFLKQAKEAERGGAKGKYASNLPAISVLDGLSCQADGFVYDAEGNIVGLVVEGNPEELQNAELNAQGEFVDGDGNVVGSAAIHEDAEQLVEQGVYEPDPQGQEATQEANEAATGEAQASAEDAVEGSPTSAEEPTADAAVPEEAGEIEDQLPGIEALQGRELNEAGEILNDEGEVLGGLEDETLKRKLAEGEFDPQTLEIDEEGQVRDHEGNVLGKMELAEGGAERLADASGGNPGEPGDEKVGPVAANERILEGRRVSKKGKVLDDNGEVIGELEDGEVGRCAAGRINEKGEVFNKAGELVGRVRVVPGQAAENAMQELLGQLGEAMDQDQAEAEPEAKAGEGEEKVGEGEEEAEEQPEESDEEQPEKEQAEEQPEEPPMEEPSISILNGLKVNKKGQVLDEDGSPIGELTAGELSQCAGKKINAIGEVLGQNGAVIGHVRTLPQVVPQPDAAPLSVLEGLKVNKKGLVLDEEGQPIGELTSGDLANLAGKKINGKGEVLDDNGDVIGTVRTLPVEEGAEESSEEGPQDEPEEGTQLPPLSTLEGLAVNKAGRLIDGSGAIVGELVEGDAKKLSKSGITADAEGQFWDNKGHVIGRAKTLPQEEAEDEAPFAGLEGLRVVEEGWVQDEEGNTVGYITEGDAQKLLGRAVDEDGDIIDKKGSVVGHAERYTPEEEEAAEEAAPLDLSFLKGKTITKTGLVIGDEGIPVARLAEGNAKELVGRQLDDQGQFWNDTGVVVGKVELIPAEEREAKPEGPFAGLEDLRVVEGGKVADEDGNVVGEITEGNARRLLGLAVDEDGDILDKYGNVKGHAEPLPEEDPVDYSALDCLTLNKQGFVVNEQGVPFGKIVEGNAADLAGRKTDENGRIYSDTGKVVGRCEPLPESDRVARPEGAFAGLDGLHVISDGKVADENDNTVGQIVDGDPKKLLGMHVDEDGDIVDKFGNVKGHAEPLPDEADVDYSILDGLTLNKQGFCVDANGTPLGRLFEGNAAELAGRQSDEQGFIFNDRGKVVGKCEPLPESERVARPEGPFAGLEGLHVVKEGKVEDENGNVVGEITEGDPKRLVGLQVDEDGDIIDKYGNTKGHAEALIEDDEQPLDNSALDGKYLNKQGYVVDEKGIPFGRLVEGNASELAGRKCDENGYIYGDTGKVVGRCEILPENERVARPEGPFAGLEGLRIVKDGFVEDEGGNRVGQLVEGEPKRLVGLHVDEDGDIIDKYGNVKGHAEPWSEEEAAAEDFSRLAGTTINKAGYAVDGSGTIIGRVVEGDPSAMIGKKVDGEGQIWDDAGNIIGRCNMAQGVGGPEGPFAGFENLQINKDGTITTSGGEGDIVGRVIEGEIKKLLGHSVDEDGDITDKHGNTIGKAERWEPDEKERRVNPMSGMRVNKEGEVRDSNGDLLGRLTSGDLGHCVGQEIDDAGNVVDVDGNKIGEVTLLENIAEDEFEGPSEEELEEARKRAEESEIAEKMGAICTQTLERMRPICKQITEYMEKADATQKEELDEEELVNNVKPLIEEGGRILQECNGSLRGLDPDGKIAAQAKGRAGTGEATPEEYRLAETLKELTTTVVTTIDDAKKKLNHMPHAKKKLNPLWALMTQPLFQILAAVGLLLAGVLGLVGQLLNGLGLGGLVNGLLGGLGINKLLSSFGLTADGGEKGKGGAGDGKNKLQSLPIVGGFFGRNK